MARVKPAEVENTEHISARDNENINAKRVGCYGYNYTLGQWVRLAVNSSGELVLGTAGGGEGE